MSEDASIEPPAPARTDLAPVDADASLPAGGHALAATDTAAASTAIVHSHCSNCGTLLQGPYCHACGQSVKSPLRHLPGLAADAFDLLFNLDGRILRTLPALYLHPGRLTADYFAGRRVRYITPFRLVFLLAVLAFLSIQVSISSNSGFGREGDIVLTSTPATVGTVAPPVKTGLSADEQGKRALDALPIDAVRVAWLPDWVNLRLHAGLVRARDRLRAMVHGTATERTAAARQTAIDIFSVAPSVLLVMLPVFALMLMPFYLLRRRLYIEHLIVAMHSHAFLMLTILLLAGLAALRRLLPADSWIDVPLGLTHLALWLWVPVYMLRMQKRVYAQGWFLTCFKFTLFGLCYCFLLALALAAATLIGLMH